MKLNMNGLTLNILYLLLALGNEWPPIAYSTNKKQ